jgi:hypothetical protein
MEMSWIYAQKYQISKDAVDHFCSLKNEPTANCSDAIAERQFCNQNYYIIYPQIRELALPIHPQPI